MKLDRIKRGLAAAAGIAALSAAQGQTLPVNGFTGNADQLLLGFTYSSSTSDLVIDLGTAAQVGVGGTGTVDLVAKSNVGETKTALISQLQNLYGSLNGLEWGVIGGHVVNNSVNTIYATVPHGAAAPVLGQPGYLNSSIQTVGQGMSDYPGTISNQGIVDPTQGYGESWTEQTITTSGQWAKNGTNPNTTTPGTFTTGATQYSLADLYVRSNSVANPAVYTGYFSFGSDGSLTFTPATTAQAPPPPRLTITRTGTSSKISFGTTNGHTYSLYFTNTAGLSTPTTNWPVSPTTVTGNGATNSITDTTADAIRFYRVIAR